MLAFAEWVADTTFLCSITQLTPADLASCTVEQLLQSQFEVLAQSIEVRWQQSAMYAQRECRLKCA